jgi:hypothetical protein
MATKLRKLVINEVSLCGRGANPGAMITLFKRDVAPETEVPRDADPLHFRATGRGTVHDRLWNLYDDRRRALGPAQGQRAFADAWSSLTDSEKQDIRDEEAAHAAAIEAQAVAAEKENKMQKLDDENLLIKAAHAVAIGTIENTVRRSTWHGELRKMAAAQQADGETISQTVSRLVQTDPDARALLKASVSGVVDDAPTAPALPPGSVLKIGTAYAKLHDIGAGFMAADPKLTREQAFTKAFLLHPELAQRSKQEQAFA